MSRSCRRQEQEDVWGADDSVHAVDLARADRNRRKGPTAAICKKGRWSFSSGCDFCHWAVLGGIAPPASAGEPPDARVLLGAAPRLRDRGQLARDGALRQRQQGHRHRGRVCTRIPDPLLPRCLRPQSTRVPQSTRRCSLSPARRSGWIFTYGIVSPAIGTAQGALDGVSRAGGAWRINVREPARGRRPVHATPRLAEAASEIDAARDRMLGIFAEMMRRGAAGVEIPLADRASLPLLDPGKAIELQRQRRRPTVRGQRAATPSFSTT